MPKLTGNALKVLERRYLLKDGGGNVIEDPDGLFRRVAKAVAAVDARYGEKAGEREEVYFGLMSSLQFLPNSPTLMNAGTRIGQYSACFVIPVGDSMKEIFSALAAMAAIHQSGGGTGFSFSMLRPKNDIVGSTGGIASGPVSFMRVFDQATEVIKQGGRRRGANMGILRADHPDILEFIDAKKNGGFRNFNLSVAVPDGFMKNLEFGEKYPLVNPRNAKVTGSIGTRYVWERIAEAACSTGDPGVIFIDKVNALNPTPQAGTIEATNPCGEQPLLPYESCNLGSINLKTIISGGGIDWDKLRRLVREAVQFLDNIIDANRYPLPEIEAITLANRKIGLGVMGFAEMLIMLGIPYASEEALGVADELMKFISEEGIRRSEELAESRGSFPNFHGSIWERRGLKHMRNATVTTVAPTGTIGIIAGASSGIEPLFAVAYTRKAMGGVALPEINGIFLDMARERGIYSDGLIEEIIRKGSLGEVAGVPGDMKRLFETALEIPPEWHVRMQAAFQRHTDNAVSKTINLPREATPDDIKEAYSLAYGLGCKGVTVFRYGCKGEQVLSVGDEEARKSRESGIEVSGDYSGECRTCSF